MRIISGSLRSRVLKSPPGLVCRPAMGRTREAIFSMLEARGVEWQSSRVLDVFAGSGSLAFEAVSRGAKYALLLENDPQVLKTIEANIRALGVENRVHVLAEDALRTLRRGSQASFDVVFVDPPYRRHFAEQALPLLVSAGWLSLPSFVVVELEHELSFVPPRFFEVSTERLFGQTRVVLLSFRGANSEDAQQDGHDQGEEE